MTIVCIPQRTGTESTDSYASSLASAITDRHATQPFTDVDELSSWLHKEHGNPRTVVRTNEAGTRITISLKDTPILNITCG